MIVLGINGGMELPHEDLKVYDDERISHDSAAVLVKDGVVISAVEEERLNRVKHTGKMPYQGIKKCLNSLNITFQDVDKFVVTTREAESDILMRQHFLLRDSPYTSAKEAIVDMIYNIDGTIYNPSNIIFIDHHTCHVASAHYMSGFDRSLTVTIDGASSEGYAGYVVDSEGLKFNILNRILNDNSLGGFYISIIYLLGYNQHDEYKVMGLAPYGDPSKFRRLFKKAYALLPEGKYQLNFAWSTAMFDFVNPRKKDGIITQEHKDIAAALQEMLETIVLHILTYYQKNTGHTKLCLAGGVAHNCAMNGKILDSGIFEEVFVQPAAHDAGNALGGALYVFHKLNPEKPLETLKHLYWGTEISADKELNEILEEWQRFITFERVDNIAFETAKLIEEGSVIGWIQGKSEFAPRALGNRSILADPRKADNKRIINGMVKKREGYRPFAPSILEEYISEYYELPSTRADFNYMNYVLRTKEDKQSSLGAVTHVDGTARVQTVSRSTNSKYWDLINEFRKLTGVPVLLNTSFNNNVEPIVDSEEDSIVSYLTTNINYLVIGDYIIRKKEIKRKDYLYLVPTRLINSELEKIINYNMDGIKQTRHQVRLHRKDKFSKEISEQAFCVLENSNGKKNLGELAKELGYTGSTLIDLVDTFIELWSLRLICLSPDKSMVGAEI